ncbi:MAG: DUF1540 domain-containing protein [Eubacteriales bacterium]|nr:DUF1540 domain-containing protein [Eubacteriales bacterium]
MQTLKCEASDCMYNTNSQCAANVIQVNGTRAQTYCDTYIKDSAFVAAGKENMGVLTGSVAADTEFGSDLTGSPRISCTVTKCAYNNSFHCRADGVEIDNPSDTMMCNCKTYRPK